MNVATVKTGRRGRPRYPRLSGYLYLTQFFFGESQILRLVSSDLDLFGEDSIFVLPSSRLSVCVSDELSKGENPLVSFMTSGKPSNLRVCYYGSSLKGDLVIPVYHGICLSCFTRDDSMSFRKLIEHLLKRNVSGLPPARKPSFLA